MVKEKIILIMNIKRGRTNKMADNWDEKYYTPDFLIDELFILKDKYCDFEPTEYLENSAGDGRIIDRFDKPYIGYDIKPEPHRTDIIEDDYLKVKLDYKKGRVCIMNPPFHKGLKFVYKSLKECDWVFTILSKQSIMNLDYTKVWAEEIQFWRSVDFGSTKVDITLMALRLKNETDKYEWE